ncbi:hypothetical protein PR048_018957 [Dryococelus australis]|uniref:Uncharacterized protein n=1 Tax=Dryococelus australis TaxID=614101 RepID=A0ABQ9H288_9NEOP|nr:hypothetical protein PR048_018957 [Dryococelus australis]
MSTTPRLLHVWVAPGSSRVDETPAIAGEHVVAALPVTSAAVASLMWGSHSIPHHSRQPKAQALAAAPETCGPTKRPVYPASMAAQDEEVHLLQSLAYRNLHSISNPETPPLHFPSASIAWGSLTIPIKFSWLCALLQCCQQARPGKMMPGGGCLSTARGTRPSGGESTEPEVGTRTRHQSGEEARTSSTSTCWPLCTLSSCEPAAATWSAITHIISAPPACNTNHNQALNTRYSFHTANWSVPYTLHLNTEHTAYSAWQKLSNHLHDHYLPLASHQGELGSIPGRATPAFSHVGIVRDGRCHWLTDFLGDLPFSPPFHYGVAPYSPQSPSSTLKTSRC